MSVSIGGKHGLPSGKEDGHYFISDPDGPNVEGDCFNCCHCGLICHVTPGSGTQRGWCQMCSKPTCGKERCHVCRPLEKQIEAMEARGRRLRALGIE